MATAWALARLALAAYGAVCLWRFVRWWSDAK